MPNDTLTLDLGILSDPISTQLAGYGDSEQLRRLDGIADAINRLEIGGFLSEAVAHSARKKLMSHTCKTLGLPTRQR
jgi:hypothetical protein